MPQMEYEVQVASTVGDEDLADIGAVTLSTTQVDTVLYGVPDQSALYGLLARLRALGLEVVEVRRVSPEQRTSSTETGDQPSQDEGDDDDGS
jgi:hypothetical protein